MAEEIQYKRVLLKVSGEALAGDAHRGLDFNVIGEVCEVIKRCVDAGVQIGVVVGGGNFWRGLKDGGDRMQRVRADHMGMLATVINALAVCDALEQHGVPAGKGTNRLLVQRRVQTEGAAHSAAASGASAPCPASGVVFSTW